MKFPNRNNLPVVIIKILGKAAREVQAHIGFSASKTTIPRYVADELELKLIGYVSVVTGAGIILLPEYEADVEVFDKQRSMVIGGLDLPEQSPVKALIGRDILDEYRVCLNGKTGEVEIYDP